MLYILLQVVISPAHHSAENLSAESMLILLKLFITVLRNNLLLSFISPAQQSAATFYQPCSTICCYLLSALLNNLLTFIRPAQNSAKHSKLVTKAHPLI
jgi:hypothetical protein